MGSFSEHSCKWEPLDVAPWPCSVPDRLLGLLMVEGPWESERRVFERWADGRTQRSVEDQHRGHRNDRNDGRVLSLRPRCRNGQEIGLRRRQGPGFSQQQQFVAALDHLCTPCARVIAFCCVLPLDDMKVTAKRHGSDDGRWTLGTGSGGHGYAGAMRCRNGRADQPTPSTEGLHLNITNLASNTGRRTPHSLGTQHGPCISLHLCNADPD